MGNSLLIKNLESFEGFKLILSQFGPLSPCVKSSLQRRLDEFMMSLWKEESHSSL